MARQRGVRFLLHIRRTTPDKLDKDIAVFPRRFIGQAVDELYVCEWNRQFVNLGTIFLAVFWGGLGDLNIGLLVKQKNITG